MHLKRASSAIGAVAALVLLAGCGSSSGSGGSSESSSTTSGSPSAASWYPTPVTVWSERGFATQGTAAQYSPIGKAAKPWNVCVSFPHLKDAYWLAASYGVAQQATDQNVNMTLVEAGGYENLDKQIQQIEDCAQNNDAVIIGAISQDGLNRTIDQLKSQGKVVIDFINGVSSPNTTAQSLVSYREIASQTAKALIEKSAGKQVTVAWFPGPKGAGFAEEANKGFTEALAGSNVKIVNTQWGDTGKQAQSQLIEDALAANSDVNYIAGTAVTAEAAIPILKDKSLTDKVGVLSYYMTPGTYQGLQQGTVLASAADPAVLTSRIAMDLAIRALQKDQFDVHVAPELKVIDQAALSGWDSSTTLAPDGWTPQFSVKAQ